MVVTWSRLAFGFLRGASLTVYVPLNFHLTVGQASPLEFSPALPSVKRDLFRVMGVVAFSFPGWKSVKTLRKGAKRETEMLGIHFKRLVQGAGLSRVPGKYV